MKKFPLLLAIILIIGLSFTSCKEVKKEEVDSREEMIDDAETAENEIIEEEAAKSDEIAIDSVSVSNEEENDKDPEDSEKQE